MYILFVGESLKNIRILHGYSQVELAKRIGVSERDIWKYENGYGIPEFHVVNDLKNLFHVKSGYFYKRDIISNGKEVVDISHISFRYY